MNVLSAFTFSGLIKSFLPGALVLLALQYALVVIIPLYHPGCCDNFGPFRTETILAVALPSSVVLGVILNSMAFMGPLDWLVRRPCQKRNKTLFSAIDAFRKSVRASICLDGMQLDGNGEGVRELIDVETYLQSACDADNISFIQEKYWVFMEFQLNLALAVVLLVASLALDVFAHGLGYVDGDLLLLLRAMLVAAALVVFLIAAARKNYRRHSQKMLSLMIASRGRNSPAKNPADPGGTDVH